MIRDSRAIIYSDSDGVICDFYAGAEKLLGHSWNYHQVDELSKLEQARIINRHEAFWETLPSMPDWIAYWNFIAPYHHHILTAVPQWDHHFDEVRRGKVEWYRRHIPALPASRIHVVYRADKAKFATHGETQNILIDDHRKNIQEFEDAGGIGIYHVSAKVTILKLKSLGYH